MLSQIASYLTRTSITMRTGTFLLVGLAVLVVVSAVEPATDEVSAATDASIVAAKAATKKALRAVKAHKDTKETDADDEQSVLKEIMNMGGPSAALAATGFAAGTGNTGSTGASGSTGATGSAHLWHFAPACNERGSFHKKLKVCKCHKGHGGKSCEFKKLNTGAFNEQLSRHESHGRYVGATNCVNGEQIGTTECECLPGWAGYHCDKRECRGKWVCANKARFCTKPTVCTADVIASTGGTGGTGSTGSTGATGATGATGPIARKPLIDKLMSNAATGPKIIKRRFTKPKRISFLKKE